MSTTTIRLSEPLKQRVQKAAEQADMTPHSFILEAIAEKAERAEQQASFVAEALAREATVQATGHALDWADARSWLKSRTRTTAGQARRGKK